MLLLAVWSAGWWIYHLLMILAFFLALSAVLAEYESASNFQLGTYFIAIGLIVTVFLALLSGDLVTLVAFSLPADVLNVVRWSVTFIFLIMAGVMLLTLWLFVRSRRRAAARQQLEITAAASGNRTRAAHGSSFAHWRCDGRIA